MKNFVIPFAYFSMKEGIEKLTKMESIEKKEKFHFPEIAELEDPMKRLIDQMRQDIENRKYGAVLGEDASGRIPARAFGEFLSWAYKKDISVPIRFWAGDYAGTPGEFKKYIKEVSKLVSDLNLGSGQKVLVVTDSIYEGRRIGLLADILKKNGISYDVAAVAFVNEGREPRKTEEAKENIKKLISPGRLMVGETGESPSIYGKYNISGVRKNLKRMRPFVEKYDLEGAEDVEFSRKDTHVLAGHLVEYYDSKTKNRK